MDTKHNLIVEAASSHSGLPTYWLYSELPDRLHRIRKLGPAAANDIVDAINYYTVAIRFPIELREVAYRVAKILGLTEEATVALSSYPDDFCIRFSNLQMRWTQHHVIIEKQ